MKGSPVDGKLTEFTLRQILEGKAKDLTATGLRLSYRHITPNKIKLTFSLCDADGNTLAKYDSFQFELAEYDYLNLVDFSRMFELKLSA